MFCIMRFIVFGAGALGSLFGGLLSRHHDVLLVGRKEHLSAVAKRGLTIEGITSGVFRPDTEWDGSSYDMVLLTTKAYDTERAAREILATFGKMPVLSLQNGIGNEEVLADVFGREQVMGGVTSHGATFVENGRIYHAGTGETLIGMLDGRIPDMLKKTADAFNRCGIPTTITSHIQREIWKKTMVNAAINGLTSILRCRNGFLLENEHASHLLERVCSECSAIARAAHMDIGEDITEKTREVARNTAENISSMLQDILKGKKTEVDEIHGAFAAVARVHGISAPINEFLAHAIRAMENVRHLG
ncbi:MAG: 2-dehydropantoate 2-reductase [Thermoplasmata archaeon]|nr:MAG: 2-dehydropantoate 2-reductase [Thermoplasmata archaeon]